MLEIIKTALNIAYLVNLLDALPEAALERGYVAEIRPGLYIDWAQPLPDADRDEWLRRPTTEDVFEDRDDDDFPWYVETRETQQTARLDSLVGYQVVVIDEEKADELVDEFEALARAEDEALIATIHVDDFAGVVDERPEWEDIEESWMILDHAYA